MKNRVFYERLAVLKSFSRTEALFWAKVDVRGPEECWPWTGGTASPDGKYFNGRFGARDEGGNRKSYIASRFAFESFHGHPPKDQALHTCDNGLCCNPLHLEDGSQSKNIKDAIARGRFTVPTNPNGHSTALTDAQVIDARCRLAIGETQASIARDFGVSKATMCRLASDKAYSRVEGGPDN